MKAFAVVALCFLALYVNAEDAVLTDEQLDSLTQEQAQAITEEEWLKILAPRCNPSSRYYRHAQYLADYRDCHHFYECVGFYPVRFVCPAGLDFNPTLNVCDWPNHAGCRFYINPVGPIEPIDPVEPVIDPVVPIVPIKGDE